MTFGLLMWLFFDRDTQARGSYPLVLPLVLELEQSLVVPPQPGPLRLQLSRGEPPVGQGLGRICQHPRRRYFGS